MCKCKMEKQTEAETEIQSNYAYDHNSVQYRQSKFYNVRIITEAHSLTLNEKRQQIPLPAEKMN